MLRLAGLAIPPSLHSKFDLQNAIVYKRDRIYVQLYATVTINLVHRSWCWVLILWPVLVQKDVEPRGLFSPTIN
jgi:hypothetical protein